MDRVIERKLNEIIEILRELQCDLRRPKRRVSISLAIGLTGVEMSNFTINPGQTKTLTAKFTDANGNTDPLGALPTATDPNGVLTVAAVGTPTVNDQQFQWTIACPTTASAGTALEVDVHAEGDPTAGVDPIDGKILGTVIAPEDTQVALSVA